MGITISMSQRAVAVGPNDLQIDVRAKGDTQASTSPQTSQKADRGPFISDLFEDMKREYRQNPKATILWVLSAIVAGSLCGALFARFSFNPAAALPSATVNANANLLSAPVAPGVLLVPVQEAKSVPESTTPLTKDQLKANAKDCADCKKAIYTKQISCLDRIKRYQKDMNEKAAYHAVGGAALHGKFVCASCKRCDPTVA